MFPCSLKICLVLFWGISGLFSPNSFSVSAPVTGNMTSTSEPGLTTEHVDAEPEAWSASRASAEASASAAAAEAAGFTSNHTVTGSASRTTTTSSPTPEQLQAFTAGDAGDSTSATALGTPAPPTEGPGPQQAAGTSGRTDGAATAESLPQPASGLTAEAAASTPPPVFTVRSNSSDTSTVRRDSTSGGAGPTLPPVTTHEASTNNLNLLVITASNSSSELIYLDGSSSDSASTPASTFGSIPASTSRSTSASTFGSTLGSTSASTFGLTPASTSGSTLGSTSGSTSASTSASSTSGSTLGSTSGTKDGTKGGSTSGSTLGSTLGPTSGSTLGSTSGTTLGSTSGSSSTSPIGVFIQHATNMAPNPTNKQTPATTEASTSPPPTVAQPCSTRGIISQCLIAIASLALLATVFMVSTVVLCAKLSTRNSKVRKAQPATELMCISTLLPERNYTLTRQRNPVTNGVLVIHNLAESDEDGGDNLTLSSFLPENDRYV